MMVEGVGGHEVAHDRQMPVSGCDPVPLPRRNLTAKRVDHAVLKSSDWEAAKTRADLPAGHRVVSTLWSSSKTAALKTLLEDAPAPVVFVSQPSTTRRNVLAIAFARTLTEAIGANAIWVAGDELYDALHPQAVKSLPRSQRPFYPREYVTADPERIRKTLVGKTVLVVEDILTTGGSVKDFLRALKSDGVVVHSVVALLGDPRLEVDAKTRAALEKALAAKEIDLPADAICDRLTRTEAGGIILHVNKVRTENGRQKLARQLQGLLDPRALESLGRAANDRDFGSEGEDPSHVGVSQRIPSGSVRGSRRGGQDIESLWASRLEECVDDIRSRAGRAAETARGMLSLHDKKMRKHNRAKPKEPAGVFAGLKRSAYEQRLEVWSLTAERLRSRWVQLRRRVTMLDEYTKEADRLTYLSPAVKLAERILTKRNPELAALFSRSRQSVRGKDRELLMEEKARNPQGLER